MMFVFTLKPKNIKKYILLLISLAVSLVVVSVCVAFAVLMPPDTAFSHSFGEYKTSVSADTGVEGFIAEIELCANELYSANQVYIPTVFNEVYNEYNALQIKQGFDLEKYKGAFCTLYTYKLKDYTLDNSDAYISVIVYKDRVIGGHISSLRQNARMYTFFGE